MKFKSYILILFTLISSFLLAKSSLAAVCAHDNGAGVGCSADWYCSGSSSCIAGGTFPGSNCTTVGGTPSTIANCSVADTCGVCSTCSATGGTYSNGFQLCGSYPSTTCSLSKFANCTTMNCGTSLCSTCANNYSVCNIAGGSNGTCIDNTNNHCASYTGSCTSTGGGYCATCTSGYTRCAGTNTCVATQACYNGQTFDPCTNSCIGFSGLKLGYDSLSGTSVIQSPTYPALYFPSGALAGNLGIGTTAPGATLDINGSFRAFSASISGFGGSGDRLIATDNSGNLYATSSASLSLDLWKGAKNGNIWNGDAGLGNVGIGTTNPGATLDVVGNTAFTYSFTTLPNWTTGVANNWIATNVPGNSSYSNMTAFQGKAIAGNGYALDTIGMTGIAATEGYGTFTQPSGYKLIGVKGGISIANGNKTIDSAVSLYGYSSIVGSNTINNYYGLYLETPTGGTYGTKWGVYQQDSGSKNYFAGNVGMGTTAPGQKLTVTDTLAITNIGGAQTLLMGNQNSSGVNNPALIMSANGELYFGHGSSWSGSGGTQTLNLYLSNAGGLSLGTYASSYNNPGAGNMIVPGSIGVGMNNPASAKLQIARDVPALVGYGNAQLILQGATDLNKQLLLGVDTTNNYAFIQPLHAGVNWSDYNLALVPVGGKVGIGTTAPVTSLDVIANNGFRNNYATTLSLLGGGGDHLIAADSNGMLYATGSPALLSLWNGTKNGNIWNGDAGVGRVGIGTTNPIYSLDVTGSSGFTTIDKIGPGSNNPERGAWNPLWSAIASGRAQYTDEEFAVGYNGINVYNNSGGTGVQHFWESGDGSQPNSSGKWIRIVDDGSTTSPGYGGFYQTITCSRNKTFVQRFRAKLPVGYVLNIAENAQGTNNTSYWLTSQNGTGKWEEYIRVSHCGNTGSFSNGGHVYVTGGSHSFTWYLASSNVYEADGLPGIFSGKVGIGTTNPGVTLDMPGTLDSFRAYSATIVGFQNAGDVIVMADNNGNLFSTSSARFFAPDMNSNLNMNNHNIFGVNKLTVNTIDPLYTINGNNYSTYASSISGGVKEEYVGHLKIDEEKLVKSKKLYEKIIDFDKIKEGEDLWVWHKVIDFSKDNVEVLITPYGKFADVYYVINDHQIIFRSSLPAEISYRLIGKRIDWRSWPTKQINGEEKGIIIN